MHGTTIDTNELAQFRAMADEWWDPAGKMKPLHALNPIRLGFIREEIEEILDKSIQNLDIIDVGCGGGLVTEPLARLGANIVGLEAEDKIVDVALQHAMEQGLQIDYVCSAVEEYQAKKFDVVLALEIVEHVSDVSLFLESCANLLNDNGVLIVSTLNRTPKSFLKAIVGAEYILRWVPRGTHDWKKFLKPSEIYNHLSPSGLKLHNLKGLSYKSFSKTWELSNDLSVNYIMSLRAD
jgi:2-polyprenyl-6-hydroxyphenyl methylase / 3-demethylubiquinone-9 3-methyltransferase